MPDLLHPVHVGDELWRPGLDRRRVPVHERKQLQSLPYSAVARRPTGALRPLPCSPVRLLDSLQERRLSGGTHGLSPRHYLPHHPGALLEVPPEGECSLEDYLPQLS